MTDKIVELIRRFTPMSSRSAEWDFLMPGTGKPQRWHEIEDAFRVLVIADPGAGKTFEAQTRARRIKERGRHAFFIRIEKIDGNFDQAFEVGGAAEFAAWLASTDEAWFFLDSVDEAQLETPRALADAVRIFGTRCHAALDRARIFITSREDAWRALPDQTLVEQHLPYGEPEPAERDDDTRRDSDPTLKLFRLAGLNEDEIGLFASHYGVSDVSDFVDAVKRADLLQLAERPFDLKALIRVWIADHKLGSRFDVLQRMIALQLAPLTQSFNTTTSMGRLMLNVLLSFAQFEREVTGERIRDKIAASKAKGLWMGGNVPLGYEVKDRKLVIDEADAATVRTIFRRYAELGSGRALIEELREQGYRTKVRPQSDGSSRGGIPFERGMLFHMLADRVYLGEIVHKGKAHPGEHPAIVDRELWDRVQAQIAANSVGRTRDRNVAAPSLLTGIIVDGHGRRMSPSHAVKQGRRYRYYVTHAATIREGEPPAWRLPAHDVEALVLRRVQQALRDPSFVRGLVGRSDAATLVSAIELAHDSGDRLDAPTGRRTRIATLVEQVRVGDAEIAVTLNRAATQRTLGSAIDDDASLLLTAPAARLRKGKAVKLVLTSADGASAQKDDALVALVAEAHAARAAMLSAPTRTIKETAAALGTCRHRFAQLVRVGYLAPGIVNAIVAGRQPAALTARTLLTTPLPLAWDAQKAMLGFA